MLVGGLNHLSNDLVDEIYEAAIIGERWPAVLDKMVKRYGATAAVCARLCRGKMDFISPHALFKETWEEIVRDHGGSANERTRRLVKVGSAGFITDGDVFDKAEAAQLPLYRDILIPRGFGSGLATAVSVPSGDFIILNLEKPYEDGPFAPKVVAALDALRPHFARAAFISGRLEIEKARNAVWALEHIGLPAAVIGRNGRTMAMNDRMAQLTPSLVQDRPSRLSLATASADKLLANALAEIQAGCDGLVRSIPTPAAGDNPPIIFHLSPVKGAAQDIFSQAIAILIATPVVPRDVPTASVVQGLFDLTPSEAKLAALVAAGHRPKEAAAHLNVTTETARTTLKRLFAKTGVHRQSDLVALLAGTNLPMRN